MSITCQLCGTEIKDNENVCPLCGTAVENTSAPVVEEVKPAPVAPAPPAVEEAKPAPVAVTPAPAMEESKFVCTGCGKEYPNGGKFCSECGGKIEEKKPVIVQKDEAPKFVCTGCGKEYPAGTAVRQHATGATYNYIYYGKLSNIKKNMKYSVKNLRPGTAYIGFIILVNSAKNFSSELTIKCGAVK